MRFTRERLGVVSNSEINQVSSGFLVQLEFVSLCSHRWSFARASAVPADVRSPRAEAFRVRLEKALAHERADPVEAPVGPITEPAIKSQESAPVAQQEPASSSSGPAAPMPTQNLENEQMDSPMEMGQKNAENAKERGQARRQQVKSLEDQW